MQAFRDEIEKVDTEILKLHEERLKNVLEIAKLKDQTKDAKFLPLIEFEKRKKALQFYGNEALELLSFLMGQARAKQEDITVVVSQKNLGLCLKLMGPYCHYILEQDKDSKLLNYFYFTDKKDEHNLALGCQWVLESFETGKKLDVYPVI